MIENKDKRFLMIGLIVPGTYDRETDSVSAYGHNIECINPCKFIQTTVAMAINMTMGSMNAAVKHCQSMCASNENIAYIYLNHETLRLQARVILGGKLLRNFGDGYKVVNFDNVASELAQVITDICLIVNIKRVYVDVTTYLLDSDRKELNEQLNDMIINKQNVPEVVFCPSFEFTRQGGIETLRKIWLERIISNF